MKAWEKEFKRWLEAHPGRYTVPALKMGFDGGWRAGLEWTLKTAEELEEQDVPIGMQEVIEQELESGK